MKYSNNQKKSRPWLLEILGNRELQQDQQAPEDKRECQGSNFIPKANTVLKLRDRWVKWRRIMNIGYTPAGQQDQASHHFHEHPKDQAERGQVCVQGLRRRPQMTKVWRNIGAKCSLTAAPAAPGRPLSPGRPRGPCARVKTINYMKHKIS